MTTLTGRVDSGPLRERINENAPVTAGKNHPIAAERGVGRHDIEENFCSRSLSRLLKLESKQANMMQESLKVYRLVIFLALVVSFVSGKINVTNNIIVLHRPFGIVFQFFAWGVRSEY